MAKGARIIRKLNLAPCPRCYKPMTGDVCVSKGCQIAGERSVRR